MPCRCWTLCRVVSQILISEQVSNLCRRIGLYKYAILLTPLDLVLFTLSSCAVHPVGILLFDGVETGTEILILRIVKFPGTFLRINFKCRVRLCDATTDFFCYEVSSQQKACRTFRKRFVIETVGGSWVVGEVSWGREEGLGAGALVLCLKVARELMAWPSWRQIRETRDVESKIYLCISRLSHRLETFMCTCVVRVLLHEMLRRSNEKSI